MDPNEALRVCLELARKLDDVEDDGSEDSRAVRTSIGESLAEAVLDLHSWLRKGGFLPRLWNEKAHRRGVRLTDAQVEALRTARDVAAKLPRSRALVQAESEWLIACTLDATACIADEPSAPLCGWKSPNGDLESLKACKRKAGHLPPHSTDAAYAAELDGGRA